MRRIILVAAAALLGFGAGRAEAIPELIPTVPIPENGYTGQGREILCAVEPLDPGKIKYDFVSEGFYVQDFDGYYRLHVDHGHVGLPHD